MFKFCFEKFGKDATSAMNFKGGMQTQCVQRENQCFIFSTPSGLPNVMCILLVKRYFTNNKFTERIQLLTLFFPLVMWLSLMALALGVIAKRRWGMICGNCAPRKKAKDK